MVQRRRKDGEEYLMHFDGGGFDAAKVARWLETDHPDMKHEHHLRKYLRDACAHIIHRDSRHDFGGTRRWRRQRRASTLQLPVSAKKEKEEKLASKGQQYKLTRDQVMAVRNRVFEESWRPHRIGSGIVFFWRDDYIVRVEPAQNVLGVLSRPQRSEGIEWSTWTYLPMSYTDALNHSKDFEIALALADYAAVPKDVTKQVEAMDRAMYKMDDIPPDPRKRKKILPLGRGKGKK